MKIRKFLDEIFKYKSLRIEEIDYNNYWNYRNSHGSKGLKSRDEKISKLIKNSSSVLDIGCGNGRLLEHLIEKKNVEGMGIDFSEEALQIAKEKGIPTNKLDLESEELDLDRKYDYIVMSEIVEHLKNPEKLMSQVEDNFKNSLIITLPNIGHFTYRLRLLFGSFPECWKWHPGEHIRFWTKKDFTYWIEREDNGFSNMKVKKMIPGECVPDLPTIDSLTAYNYIAEVENDNIL